MTLPSLATAEMDEPLPEPRRVYRIGGVGAALIVLASLLGIDANAALDGPRVALTLIGLVTAGTALSMRSQDVVAWGIALVAALLSLGGFPVSWDSYRLVAGVAAGVSLLGLILVKLPLRWRLRAAAILIPFHFLGIYTAITVTLDQPWLFAQLWSRVYRPYLQFVNLDNSYQFFAPDPGSSSDLWFCIEYDTPDRDQRLAWVVVPRRSDSHDPLFNTYYRKIKLPEMAAHGYTPAYLLDCEAREVRSLRDAKADAPEAPIPRHPNQPDTRQFFIPAMSIQQLIIPSYIQHVARDYQRPGLKIKSIKLYRVLHDYVTPAQFVAELNEEGKKARRITPFDPTTFLPYYMGTFDASGALLPGPDPMRWWMIPILAKPDLVLPPVYFREIKDTEYERSFLDYVRVHAGDDGYRKGP